MKRRNRWAGWLAVLLVLCLTGCAPAPKTPELHIYPPSTGFRPEIRPMPVIFLRRGDNTVKILSGSRMSSSLERMHYGTYEIKDGVLTVTGEEVGTLVFRVTGRASFEYLREASQPNMFRWLEDGAKFYSIGYIEDEDVLE